MSARVLSKYWWTDTCDDVHPLPCIVVHCKVSSQWQPQVPPLLLSGLTLAPVVRKLPSLYESVEQVPVLLTDNWQPTTAVPAICPSRKLEPTNRPFRKDASALSVPRLSDVPVMEA